MGTLHSSLCAVLVLVSSSMQETGEVQGPSCSSFVSSTVLLIKLQLAVLDLWLQSGQHKVVAIAGLADLLCRRLMAWDGRVANPFQNTFAAAEDDPSPSPTATMQVLSARTMLQNFIQPVTAEQNHRSLVKILENLNCRLEKAPWDKRRAAIACHSVELN